MTAGLYHREAAAGRWFDLSLTSFASPSAAAKAVIGHGSEAGWDFWRVDEDGARVTLSRLRERMRADG